MNARAVIPPEFEEHRDRCWRREGARQVETVTDAERFIEEVGFAACLTDSRRPGPSLYVAVCGRRDAVKPRHIQKDPEASLTWVLKDDVLRRGRVYYGKFVGGRTWFIAPRMVPYFHALWGMRRADEKRRLSTNAQAILRVLRREWEMATIDLRTDSGVTDRQAFTRAMDELQACMLVVPSEVLYEPRFTYIWTLAVGRFSEGLTRRVSRETALREVARCFLAGAGITVPGELARVTGLSRPDAGLGNQALVAEGYADQLGAGLYKWPLSASLQRPADANRTGAIRALWHGASRHFGAGSAPMSTRIARAIDSRLGASAAPAMSMLSAKNTGPSRRSTQPTHQPIWPSTRAVQPVLARRIQSLPASLIMMSFTRRWCSTRNGRSLR